MLRSTALMCCCSGRWNRETREGTFKRMLLPEATYRRGRQVQILHRAVRGFSGVFGDAIISATCGNGPTGAHTNQLIMTKAGIARLKAAGETWKRGPNRKYKAGNPSRTTLWRRAQKKQRNAN